jgi:hypothetical protein
MTSQYLTPTARYKIRDIRPVSRARPCYLDLNAHPYHVYESSIFLAAFSSVECAEHSAEDMIRVSCSEDRYELVQNLRIVDIISGLEYRRKGSTWEPVNGPNGFHPNVDINLRRVIQ